MKRAFSRYAALALLGAAILSGGPASAQPNDVTKLPAWARSVVKIWVQCQLPDGTMSLPGEGAGVIVHKDGLVLTAAHVGKDCVGKPGLVTRIGPVDQIYFEPAQKFTATLVARQVDNNPSPGANNLELINEQDLALYKIDNFVQGASTVAKLSKKTLIPGQPLAVAGFPNLPVWFTPGHPGPAGAKKIGFSLYKTHLLSVAATSAGVPFRLHYGSGTLEGMSGGPVFNEAGELVGIHSTRSTKGVFDALLDACDKPSTNNRKCFGNAITIPKGQLQGATEDRTVYLDVAAIKNILEGYAWATSVNAIPPAWLSQMSR